MEYKRINGNMTCVKIQYCLENRMPVMCMIDETAYSQNLIEFCKNHATDIHHLSFDDYYGKMTEHCIKRLYPYICCTDKVEWNVPYEDVTIGDFLCTFPAAKENGITVYANNVAAGGEMLDLAMQAWTAFSTHLPEIKTVLDTGMTAFSWGQAIYTIAGWVNKTVEPFGKQKATPMMVRRYIRTSASWDMRQLKKQFRNMDANTLSDILNECGYISIDGMNYQYDSELADRLQQEEDAYQQQYSDQHGTSVNCYTINHAVDELNVDLIYYAILLWNNGKLDQFDNEIKTQLDGLDMFSDYIAWDPIYRKIKFVDEFPDDFSADMEFEISLWVENVSRRIRKICARLELMDREI